MNKGIYTAISAIALLAFTALPASADSVQGFDPRLDSALNTNPLIEHAIIVPEHGSGLGSSLAGDFGDAPSVSQGKHLGFSVAAVNRGPRLGIVRPSGGSTVTENPEPASMLLLGTGLAALGAYARSRRTEPNALRLGKR